ncbi:Bug family tripartite tricarboxylate transporter substrate binding protein [Marinomonas flavescens]|uniref:Bug family tripartite tricarboxylate transporter substrate binding protein n=1 Tax=Marinomonas flavescens TaxID=2529379 RepID=UPI0010557863|nr:tripartite tricarboxylate transporter substrate binding protein [Marinomonas flavescens]
MNIKNTVIAISLVTSSLVMGSSSVYADWPTKDIHLVVPYSAGGNTDILSREVAHLLQKELDVNVIVENRPGAGSTVATGRLARGGRNADHTILMASPGHVIGASIYPNLPYNAVSDFKFITKLLDAPNIMVVPSSSPYNTVAEFIAAAKSKPMTFSHPGVGSSVHMSGELFKTLTKTKLTAVPFPGSGAALPALLSGDVDVSFENASTVLPYIQSGGLKALAVTSKTRFKALPNVPTVIETEGYDLSGFVTTVWNGVIAGNAFPDEGVEVLQAALQRVKESEEFNAFIDKMGAEASPLSGEEFKSFISSEVIRWKMVAEEAGVRQS